jgi:hypothetical protein
MQKQGECFENGQRACHGNRGGRAARRGGVAIVLTEEPGALPNWVAAAGIMEAALTDKFSEKVAELIETDPLVDWNEVDKGQSEFRRVVKFLSAAE